MRAKVDPRVLFDRLSEGERPRVIAKELGCSYSTLRRNLSRFVEAIGCQTPEEAVAKHVAEKIKRALPAALAMQIDMVMRRR